MRIVFHGILFIMISAASYAQADSSNTQLNQSASPNRTGKACFCEIGDYPYDQQGFFRVGCSLWFMSQSGCESKDIVRQNTRYEDLKLPPHVKELAVGYVGHWSSSAELIRYLKFSIIPIIKNQSVRVSVDNTACSAMSDPEEVLKFIENERLPETGDETGSQPALKVKGNQTTSIGKWDVVMASSINFTASVSSRASKVQYPRCRDQQGYVCVQQLQYGEEGKCVDSKGEIKTLRCCTVQQDSISYEAEQTEKFAWETRDKCLDQ